MINTDEVIEIDIILSNKKTIKYNQFQIVYLEIIESIFSFFMYGTIQLYDVFGFLENFILTGNERIKITYGRSKKIEKYFNLHSLNMDRRMDYLRNEKSIYSLQIVEEGFKNFAYLRYSKSWNDVKISDIVSHITKHMIKREDDFVQFEDTKESMKYVMSNTSSAAALHWLLPRGSSNETNTSGYLYFSNARGLNYVSIEKLLNEKIEEKDNNGQIMDYIFDYDKAYVNKILDYSYKGIDYSLVRDLAGGIATGFDIEVNRQVKYQWEYKDIIKKYTSFGKYTLLPDISSKDVEVSYYDDITSETLQNIVEYSFIKKYIRLCTVDIQPLYAYEGRYAGMISYISWPSNVKSNFIDKSLDGKWLLLTVKNIFSSDKNNVWKQVLTYGKNGYLDSDNKDLHEATKINTDVGVSVLR
jgi:hypothetical protein